MSFIETNKKNPKRGGWYHFTVDGKDVKYPSITNILGVLDKSRFLVPWAAKQCIELACDEPWLSVEDIYAKHRANGVVKAGNRGKGVHNIGAKILNDRDFKSTEALEEAYEPYLTPLRAFYDDFKPIVVSIEKVVKSHKYGIGGSLDFILQIGKETWLVDIKTSKAIYPSYHLQLEFYKHCCEQEGIHIDKVCVLHLSGNGKYGIINTKGDLNVVQSLKTAYMWLEENK